MDFDFEWDRQKAKINLEKHEVSFEEATTVFKDCNALTIYDTKHSHVEDRYI
ncbi:MAG: BrnT family toxin, partial [Kiritimatiellae bacterium]|nr:BrnT family toxin [Kiritimatiellia bacterium]